MSSRACFAARAKRCRCRSRRCSIPRDCCSRAARSRASTTAARSRWYRCSERSRASACRTTSSRRCSNRCTHCRGAPRSSCHPTRGSTKCASSRSQACRYFPIRVIGARHITGSSRSFSTAPIASTYTRPTRRSSIATRSRCTRAISRANARRAGGSWALARKRKRQSPAERGACRFTRARLMPLVTDLVNAGWRVEAEGVVYRPAAHARASVTSGIDWFELSAGVRYGDIDVSLQELLAARRKGATTIELPDGSHGVIPYRLARATRTDRRRRHGRRWIAALFAFSNSAARRAARHAPRSRRRRDLRQSARRAARLRSRRAARPTSLIPRNAARIPARRTRLASLPAHLRTRRLPGRRHGARQDRSGARAARCAAGDARKAVATVDRRRPAVARVQLAARSRAIHAEPACARLFRRRPSNRNDRRRTGGPRDHDVRHAATRHRAPRRDPVRLRDSRRGAGDQDTQLGVGQGGSPAPSPTIGWR